MPLKLVLVHAFSWYLSTAAYAQTVPPGSFAFEVASVMPSPRPEPNPFGFPVRPSIRIEPGGRFNATQTTLRDLIQRAYDLPPFLIVGGPEWATSDRFDVLAKAEGGAGNTEQIRGMLRGLLAERFALRVRTESRELPMYALVLARRDGRLGPQLRPSSLDCAAIRAKRAPDAPPPPGGSEPDCERSYKVGGGVMTLGFQGESMDDLARLLTQAPETRRLVTNRTALAGTFDGALSFAPEPLPGLPRLPESSDGVSVFTALQEQFGLKLEAGRGPVDVLVVDSAEKLTTN